MEIVRILSLTFLFIIDLAIITGYMFASKDEDKSSRNILLVLLTIFIIPTIYIVLN